MTTVEWRYRAMIDFCLEPGVGQSQYATAPLHISAPDNREAVRAASQELIIPIGGIEPQNVAAPVVLQASVEGRSQRMLEDVAANPRALNQSVPARRSEVNAGVDAGIGVLLRRLRKADERTSDAGKRRAARRCEADRVRAEEAGQDFGGGRAKDAVRRWIVGDIRRHQKREPRRIRDRVRVVICPSRSDRRDGTPEIVKVFGLKSGDKAIGHGEVEQGQESRALPQIEASVRQDISGNAIPSERRAFIPE